MSDIVAFLRARLDEDEAAVYRWDSDARCVVATMWTGDEPGYTTVASSHDGDCWIADGHEVVPSREPRVLFDPARMLRDVDAKRQIVDWCTGGKAVDGGYLMFPPLEMLAAVYADHSDYDPEWRLQAASTS